MLSDSVHKELSRPTDEGKEGRGKVKNWACWEHEGEPMATLISVWECLLIKCMTGSMVLKEPVSFGSYFLPYESERCLLPNWFLPVILIIKSVLFS